MRFERMRSAGETCQGSGKPDHETVSTDLRSLTAAVTAGSVPVTGTSMISGEPYSAETSCPGPHDHCGDAVFFRNAKESAAALAAAILDALRREDARALRELRVSGGEFTQIIWPEIPQSRPPTNLRPMGAWFFLERYSIAGINEGLLEWGGRDLRLRRISFDIGGVHYPSFHLHHGVRIHVKTPEGDSAVVRFACSFAEHNGKWKVYTYKD
jgi:hypothetical protein